MRGLRRNWPMLLLAVLLLAAAANRFILAYQHFPHIDDIGVAVTIDEAKLHPASADQLLAIAEAREATGRVSPRIQLLLTLNRWGVLRPLSAVTEVVYPFVAVPLTWTYAPGQFLLTAALVKPSQSYQETKFWGRLPSVIVSLLGILVLAWAASLLGRGGAGGMMLLIVGIVGFSGQHTIIASLMYSYAATGAAAAALLLLVVLDSRRTDYPWRFILKRSLMLIGLCYLSYQVVVLLPGYFLALLVGTIKPFRGNAFAPS